MIFFKPTPDDSFELARLSDKTDYEVFNLFNGSSLSIYWAFIIDVMRVTESNNRILKPSDFPWLGDHVFIMRKKACDMLLDIFIKNGEILPLRTDNDVKLFVYNSQVINALDEDKSSVIRSPDSGRITRIEKPEFIKSKLSDVDIFRPPFRASPIYVSEYFVEQYKSSGLVGLEFKEVWCSHG